MTLQTQALLLAKKSLDPKQSWGAVSKKMAEFGTSARWSGDTCRKKWAALHPQGGWHCSDDDFEGTDHDDHDDRHHDTDHYWENEDTDSNPRFTPWSHRDTPAAISGVAGRSAAIRSPEEDAGWIKQEHFGVEDKLHGRPRFDTKRGATMEINPIVLMTERPRQLSDWKFKR
jgi:hypothetical protein